MKEGFFSNLVVFFSAQSGVTILGVLRTVLLPLLLSVNGFGEWQTFVLYISFLGLFSLGFNDGVVLKLIGVPYDSWHSDSLRSAFVIFIGINVILTLALLSPVLLIVNEENRLLAVIIIFNIPIVSISGLLMTLLQATNEMNKYSLFIALDKILLTLLVVLLWLSNNDNVLLLMYADIGFRILTILVLLYYWRKLLFGPVLSFRQSIREYYNLVSAGSKLLLANVLSMLIFSAGRFIVQITYSVDLFAVYSFGIVLTNFIMIAITSTSTVIYPYLAKINRDKLPGEFLRLNRLILLISPIIFLMYFPVEWLVFRFYQEYLYLMNFFVVFLSFVIVTARMSVLNNTFFKLLRLEKEMLRVNALSFSSLVICYLLAILFLEKSLILVALVTLLALLFRAYISQRLIMKNLSMIFSVKEIVLDMLMMLLVILLFVSKFFTIGICVIVLFSVLRFIEFRKFITTSEACCFFSR